LTWQLWINLVSIITASRLDIMFYYSLKGFHCFIWKWFSIVLYSTVLWMTIIDIYLFYTRLAMVHIINDNQKQTQAKTTYSKLSKIPDQQPGTKTQSQLSRKKKNFPKSMKKRDYDFASGCYPRHTRLKSECIEDLK